MFKYKLVDLFAGAGGMSYGFLQTNKFDIKLAVEINKSAQKTYIENHKNKKIEIRSNILDIAFNEVKNKYGNIDFVIGGPPCQGFSNANRQRNTLISNNNKLVKEYIRAIEMLSPRGFVLENVKTMNSIKHKFYLSYNDQNDEIISTINIKEDIVEVAENNELVKLCVEDIKEAFDNNIDFNEFRLDNILMNTFRKAIKKNDSINFDMLDKYCNSSLEEWIDRHNSYICNEYKIHFIKLRESIISRDENNIIRLVNEMNEVQKIISKIVEVNENEIIMTDSDIISDSSTIYFNLKSYNIFQYVKAKLISLGYLLEDFVLDAINYGVPQYRQRLIIIGIKKDFLVDSKISEPKKILDESNYFTIQDAISDLEYYDNSFIAENNPTMRNQDIKLNSKLQQYLCDSIIISNLTITETRENAMKRFKVLKPGQNFHDLDSKLKSTYTDPKRTQSSIYKRLDYKTPSGTVTNVRKSMWIHPTIDRALSIREAARLQSFPDSFVFYGTKDEQYQQIGNAVPPMLSRAIAEKLLELVGEKPEKYLKDIIR